MKALDGWQMRRLRILLRHKQIHLILFFILFPANKHTYIHVLLIVVTKI